MKQDTDKLELFIELAGSIKRKIDTLNADGIITRSEWFSLLPYLMDVSMLVPHGAEAIEELIDVDIIEAIDLSNKSVNEVFPDEDEALKTAVANTIVAAFANKNAVQGWMNLNKLSKEDPNEILNLN